MCTGIGLILEHWAAFDYGHSLTVVLMVDVQHVTMFMFFFVAGVADILMCKNDVLPPGTDYVMNALAFVIEGVLLQLHLYGRNRLDIQLHSLLLYVIFACAVTGSLELKYNSSILVFVVRAYCVFLQGTWFAQIGHILYSPTHSTNHSDPCDHDHLSLAAIIFAWHWGGIIIVMTAILFISDEIHRRCPSFKVSAASYNIIEQG